MLDATFSGNHVDAVDGTRLDAKIATSALVDNHGVHQLRSTENRINRTGLNAFGAADALVLADIRNGGLSFDTVFRVQWLGFNIEQIGQRLDCVFTTWRTLVDRVTVGNRLSVGPASRVATLTTLGLGQYRIDLIGERVALDLEANGRIRGGHQRRWPCLPGRPGREE